MRSTAATIELIADQTGDIFVRLGPNGLIRYISGSVRTLGYEPSQIIGMNGIELVHPDDKHHFMANVESAWRGEELNSVNRTNRYRKADGSWVWLEGNPRVVRNRRGQVTEVVNIMRDVSERRAVEERAAADAAVLRAAFDHEGVGKALVGLDGSFLSINQAFCEIVGYPQAVMLKLDFQTITHPDDLNADLELLQQLTQGDIPGYRMEKRYLRADGSVVWVELTVSMIRDEQGEPKLYVAQVQDQTEQRSAKQALKDSEARYRLLAENATDVIACFGTDAVFTYLSPSVEALLGYLPEELVGQPTKMIMHPDDLKASFEVFRAHLAGPDPRAPFSFEYRAYRKDGAEVWLAAHPRAIFDPTDGSLTGFQDVVRDVSARRAIEAALAEKEARFRLLAENASDMVMVSQPDGLLTYLSPSVLNLTGYTPEEIVGKSALHWIHPDDRRIVVETFQEQVASRGAAPSRVIAVRVIRKDGAEVWIESSPRAQVDPTTGAVTHVTDAGRDITERKTAERLLAEAKAEAEAAAEAKAVFLATMSHELRTPLTAVVGFARLTAGQPDLPPAARHYVDRLVVGAKALMSTINDILDFSKLEAGQVDIRPAPVSPEVLLSEGVGMFEGLASDRGLTLSLDWTGPAPASLLLDEDRVRQVLLNLIGNAVKFTEAGRVDVEAGYDETARRFRCAVRDTGPGLTDEQRAKLFQRFSQVDGSLARKHGGTGLGLAICKGIIEAMGGVIDVSSAPGQGSCFWFEVPADPIDDTLVRRSAPEQLLSDARILVAEDNATNRELVRLMLTSFGADLTEAVNGVEAVALAGRQPFDLILMDLRMPEMGGREAAEAIRAGDGPNADVPILAFSADTLTEAGPFDGAVGKPIEASALIRAVAEALSPYDAPADMGARHASN